MKARSLMASVMVAVAIAMAACSAAGPADPSPAATMSVASVIASAEPAAPHGPAGPERLARHAFTRPAQPTLAARYRTELVPDPCVDRDIPAPIPSDPAMAVLDRSYALPSSFVPDDLVPAAEAGFEGVSGTKLVSAIVARDLSALREASEEAGLSIAIDSAYRSYPAQSATFDAWVAQVGAQAALARAARPGHSEHQLGTAIDVSSPGWSGRFGDWASETPEGAWMAEHAWEHGFVMSYPAGAQTETCFGYEPWHYRWIGREAAAQHGADDIALRTFLAERTDG